MAASLARVLRISTRRSWNLRSLPSYRSYTIAGEDHGTDGKTSDFGFTKVTKDSHGELVSMVFKNVANRYDLMNDVMSFGIHRLWKDRFMEVLNPMPGTRLLDVAGGTGDIAFRFIDYIKRQGGLMGPLRTKLHDVETSSSSESSSSDSEYNIQETEKFSNVTLVDINEKMVKVGKRRARKEGYDQGISFIVGDAQDLPIEDESVDAYTIVFGIRNVTDVPKVCLIVKVVKLYLETIHRALWGSFLYDAYSLQVIPPLGEIFAADWKSYKYLVESIRTFYNQEQFSTLMEETGFRKVHHEDINMGIVAIYSGFKL
ncbi:2-methoxy-6-polyprenyl-1,4-benzoquinol methylase, mitochondrial-like [Saccoglossus kowalevskii]|uniref:2-methoxy-6-polyprenyl-1,4-benzoquinol methylase, mitochondrial n=1 Tax=Saccoglossus kowalevskii TaxID=10224 RepID=A0ABM0GP29_SACKO|nr:PREDICTED: 2-methoxy-6-polyprenyl-1,4-benzoquinol methylase, mitochondrial-like [Saccoglossus kowalevskii]